LLISLLTAIGEKRQNFTLPAREPQRREHSKGQPFSKNTQ
jgi:hypothetical protein